MSPTDTLQAAPPREDRATRAYEQLRALIVHGNLAPGTWVIEADVAARLGVSRTPVRAAIQRLEQEGYIIGTARGLQYRAAVSPLTREDAREIFAIVGELEALAARNAAGLATAPRAALVNELTTLNERMRAASQPRPDQNRLFDADTAFHLRYVVAGAGSRLLALHQAIKPQAERYIRLYYSALVEEIAISLEEHEIIIDAIRRGKDEAAQSAVEINWRNAAERLKRVIDTVGERGSW